MMFRSKIIRYVFVIVLVLSGLSLALFVLKPPFLMPPVKYEVIPAYEGQARYVDAARADPKSDLDALYKKFVSDIYKDSCGGNGLVNINTMSYVVVSHPIGTLDQMDRDVQGLHKFDTVQSAKTALQKSSAKLPGSKITLCLFVLDPYQQSWVSIFMNGVYGGTYSPTQINIEIAPNGDWQSWLSYTVAHEYHHTIWLQDLCGEVCKPSDGVKNDLLSMIIAEGRADSFAHTIYPDKEAPWTKALSEDQEVTQWQGMQKDLTVTSVDLGRYLFGDNQIPHWTGYTIGYHIVQSYIKSHPNVSLVDWTRMDPYELLKESGYPSRP